MDACAWAAELTAYASKKSSLAPLSLFRLSSIVGKIKICLPPMAQLTIGRLAPALQSTHVPVLKERNEREEASSCTN